MVCKFSEKNGQEEWKNPKRCRASLPQTVGWNPETEAEITITSCSQTLKSSVPPVHNPELTVASTVENNIQRCVCFTVKFFQPALRLSAHTVGERGWVSPWSCASDVSNDVSSRKWWRSPAVRLQGSGVKLQGVPPSCGHLQQVQHQSHDCCVSCSILQLSTVQTAIHCNKTYMTLT